MFIVYDIGWVTTENDVNQVIRKWETCTRVSINWAERWELEFGTTQAKSAPVTCRRGRRKHLGPNLTGKIRLGN
jgi:hypothetical protein